MTRRLDDIEEIDAIDFPENGCAGFGIIGFAEWEKATGKTVAIQVEVSFIPIYKNQPVFGEIDLRLRKLGLVPHAFAAINQRMIAPLRGNNAISSPGLDALPGQAGQ